MVTYKKAEQGLKNWLKGQSVADIKKHMQNWSSTGKQYARAELRKRKK